MGVVAKRVQSSFVKVSVKENEVPTEKNSSRASIFATKARYISNFKLKALRLNYVIKDFIFFAFFERVPRALIMMATIATFMA